VGESTYTHMYGSEMRGSGTVATGVLGNIYY